MKLNIFFLTLISINIVAFASEPGSPSFGSAGSPESKYLSEEKFSKERNDQEPGSPISGPRPRLFIRNPNLIQELLQADLKTVSTKKLKDYINLNRQSLDRTFCLSLSQIGFKITSTGKIEKDDSSLIVPNNVLLDKIKDEYERRKKELENPSLKIQIKDEINRRKNLVPGSEEFKRIQELDIDDPEYPSQSCCVIS